ncbi:hypothetical protein Pmani_004461 [Petrolisthes manimaculis]|uniref:Rho guanine nucleotide exchange factor 7 n=1 Tax=Petrolisthes manimaculis TaxID=1843537 RepID=A0AAE1QDM6_9EUCA|nr:hypothetical protein Pmani_004461 [Petrolisthes manimaculis]
MNGSQQEGEPGSPWLRISAPPSQYQEVGCNGDLGDMAGENGVLSVEALYSFKGKNNDELCFNKGDVITVTQREEGGWWEGTFCDKTGWFPSNYVRECKSPDESPASPRSEGEPGSPQHTQQQQAYRALVLRDILESERTHLAELNTLHATYLSALRQADVLTEGDYKQLVGNIEDVIAAHNKLLSAEVEQEQRSPREQRIGGAFLTLAPHLQGAHHIYCSNHPRAVCILEKYKDELSNFMESRGVTRPGVMFLTAGLSKAFRRLDRYAGMLHEYERHLEEGHPDRGDTQRSAHVYKELASSCTSIRRQKELELEVVTGRVHGWEGGESLGALGDVVRMGSVALMPDHRDRYLVLFPATLVTLAVSPRMTAFIFQGSHALNTIHVSRLDDTEHYKNAFEISGPGMERMVAVCQTKQDQQAWVDALIFQCRSLARPPHHSLSSPPPPLPPAHVSALHHVPHPHLTPRALHTFCYPSTQTSSTLSALTPISSSVSLSALPHATHLPPSLSSPPALCTSCGLPSYDSSGNRRSGSSAGNVYGADQNHTTVLRPAPPIPSLNLPPPPPYITIPAQYYVSRPYAILTKYFSNMYRRKVITHKLLRQLAGDWTDEDVTQYVHLRRHRTECIIHTGEFSEEQSDSDDGKMEGYNRSRDGKQRESSVSSDSFDVEMERRKQRRKSVNSTSTTCSSSDSEGYWVGGGPNDAPGSPLPQRKQYPIVPASSTLHKWRLQRLDSSPTSSEESNRSTDCSNPYGYIRYFSNNEDPAPAASPQLKESEATRRFTYTRPSSSSPQKQRNEAPEERSCSCGEVYYCLPHGHWAPASPLHPDSIRTSWEGRTREDTKICHKDEVDSPGSVGQKVHSGIMPKYQFFRVDSPEARTQLQPVPAVSASRSMPVLRVGQCEHEDKSEGIVTRTLHSSTLTIPAAPLMVASVIGDSECDYSETSTPNLCDRTIYGVSTSSEDLPEQERPISGSRVGRAVFPFRTRSDLAYYVSSCSGDETGEDRVDYYESQRKMVPVSLPLSRSEPDLWQREWHRDLTVPKYSSHLVRVVHAVEGPGQVCSCESHSHRSSDSGLADVLHHLESCPLRGDTPGLGRGSSISHCSSQLSGVKWSCRSASACQVRPLTPDPPTDGDSLLLTPITSPNTSATASCIEDSLSSFMGSTSLCHSSSTQDIGGGRVGEGVYRSGLYAHWWMKASVCPRMLALDRTRKDHLRFKLDHKPDIPPKPRCLKPSYHVRRGRAKGAVVKPLARSASTQTHVNLPSNPHKLQVLPHTSKILPRQESGASGSQEFRRDPSVLPRHKLSHLSTDQASGPAMSRDRSFESQASQVSQVTVVARLQPDTRPLHPRPPLATLRVRGIQGSQGSSETSGTELASLHSFSESCDLPSHTTHLWDSSEGLDVDFHRRASSHSLLTPTPAFLTPIVALHAPTPTPDSSNSGTPTNTPTPDAFKSTLYYQLHPPVSSHMEPSISHLSVPTHLVECSDSTKPGLPPKPPHLQSWPVVRSRSLPKLPQTSQSSLSILTKSKSTSLVARQGSFNDTPARPRRSPGGKVWSLSCLRPSPPLRPGHSPRDDKRAQRHNKRKEDKWHEDDALILRVIEAYCTSARTRYTVNSTLLDSPQVLIAEEEKIIVEETRGNQVVMEEKSLVDTVYALKDQVATLVRDYQALKTAFESERQATRALRSALKLKGFNDDAWEPDATTA